ncbi:MAG: pyridoxal-phosphate dependent enzyme, partial [bacterium]
NPLFESFKNGFEEFRPQKAGPTLATAIQIGNPVSFKKAIRVLKQLDGIVAQASEDDLANASALADREGLFVCPQTGVGLAVFLKLLETREIKPGERVVVISTAHGLKFVDFKIKYHEGRLKDVQPEFANLPIELPADVEIVREKLRTLVTQEEK